jgi:hypothetical protein
MAVTAFVFGNQFLSAWNKEEDLNSDVMKCMLTTVTYVPNQDTHAYKSSVTNEVTGTAYTATGTTITTPAITYTGGTNVGMFDADDAVWTTATISGIRIAVVYDSTPGTDATRPLITYVDMGGDQTVSAANFTVSWSASGIYTLTAA